MSWTVREVRAVGLQASGRRVPRWALLAHVTRDGHRQVERDTLASLLRRAVTVTRHQICSALEHLAEQLQQHGRHVPAVPPSLSMQEALLAFKRRRTRARRVHGRIVGVREFERHAWPHDKLRGPPWWCLWQRRSRRARAQQQRACQVGEPLGKDVHEDDLREWPWRHTDVVLDSTMQARRPGLLDCSSKSVKPGWTAAELRAAGQGRHVALSRPSSGPTQHGAVRAVIPAAQPRVGRKGQEREPGRRSAARQGAHVGSA